MLSTTMQSSHYMHATLPSTFQNGTSEAAPVLLEHNVDATTTFCCSSKPSLHQRLALGGVKKFCLNGRTGNLHAAPMPATSAVKPIKACYLQSSSMSSSALCILCDYAADGDDDVDNVSPRTLKQAADRLAQFTSDQPAGLPYCCPLSCLTTA